MSSGYADAVVIGAGPNGLVAANLLADADWEVVVCEAEREPASDGIDHLTETMGLLAAGRIPYRCFLIMGQDAMNDPTREAAWACARVPQVMGDVGGDLVGRCGARENEAFADRMAARVERAAPGFGAAVRRRQVTGPHDLRAQDANRAGAAGAITARAAWRSLRGRILR